METFLMKQKVKLEKILSEIIHLGRINLENIETTRELLDSVIIERTLLILMEGLPENLKNLKCENECLASRCLDRIKILVSDDVEILSVDTEPFVP